MVLLLAGVAYFILTKALINLHGQGSILATSIGRDRKGNISIAIYAMAIPMAFTKPWNAGACYVVVAIMWLIPDRLIERELAHNAGTRCRRVDDQIRVLIAPCWGNAPKWLLLSRVSEEPGAESVSI